MRKINSKSIALLAIALMSASCGSDEATDTPETTTPEVTTPEVTTPEVTTPEVTTPEVTTPEVTTPEVTTPEVTTPEVITPEVTTPEVTTPEVTTPESSAAYSAGTVYAAGDIVSNNNKLFQCDIPGWCSSNASYFYAPDTGTDWESAWTLVGDDTSTPGTEPETGTEPVTPDLDGLCSEFNVYPNWTQTTHSTTGDVMVHNHIAYSAKYYTSSIPGSDDTWDHHLNCDGTAEGTAALLSLPNANDPVSLKVNGWPSDFVVASPTSAAPATVLVNTINSADLSNIAKLISAFEALIYAAQNANTDSIILSPTFRSN